MNYWIQRADFEAEDRSASTAAELCAAFQQHDWASELSYQSVLESEGREWCPPGFGLVPGDGRILHLCPETDGGALCHYNYVERYRLLGLWPKRRAASRTWNDRLSSAEQLIHRFFDNRHEELLDHIRRAG